MQILVVKRSLKLGQDYYQTYARTRVERGFSSCPVSLQTQEDKQKKPGNGLFLICAKARLRETLVIFLSEQLCLKSRVKKKGEKVPVIDF